MRQDGEPSVDEILRSIKQVIARDDTRDVQGGGQEHEADDVYNLEPADAIAEEPAQDQRRSDEDSPKPDAEPLIDSGAEQAMRASLASLSGLAVSAPAAPADQAEPLERMIREMLRPMLKQWLDTNLPPIVEGIVRSEVRRITGGR